MNVEDIASQSTFIFETVYPKDPISGVQFPQVVQRHKLGEVGQQITIQQCTHSAIYLPTSGSAMAEGPRDALVSRNSATTKYPYRMALSV